MSHLDLTSGNTLVVFLQVHSSQIRKQRDASRED